MNSNMKTKGIARIEASKQSTGLFIHLRSEARIFLSIPAEVAENGGKVVDVVKEVPRLEDIYFKIINGDLS